MTVISGPFLSTSIWNYVRMFIPQVWPNLLTDFHSMFHSLWLSWTPHEEEFLFRAFVLILWAADFQSLRIWAHHHELLCEINNCMLFELTSVQLDDNLLFISWIRQTCLTVVVMFQCIRTMWVWTARRFRSSCLWCWQTPTTSVCRSTAPSCGAKPWVSHHITFLIYLTLLVLVDVKLFTFYFSQSFYFVV